MAKIKIFLNQNDCHAEAEYDPGRRNGRRRVMQYQKV